MTVATRLTLLRIVPVIVLAVVAIGSQQIFGLPRLQAALVGLAAALGLRLALAKAWRGR